MNTSTIHRQPTGRRWPAWSLVILAAALLGFSLSAALTLWAASTPPSHPASNDAGLVLLLACGDGKCDLGESLTCPDDCSGNDGSVGGNNGSGSTDPTKEPSPNDPVCGDGVCEGRENATNCALDCLTSVSVEPPPNTCGNGTCDNGEDTLSCPTDCVTSVATAPVDVCGDGICDPTESADACPSDCSASGEVCGNGVCEDRERANSTCLADCPISVLPVCGNLLCETGETFDLCPKDCPYTGPVCGDGVCEDSEQDTCNEDCRTSVATRTPNSDGGDATPEDERSGGDEESASSDEEEQAGATATSEAQQEAATQRAAPDTQTPEAAALAQADDRGPSCILVDYDQIASDVQTAFADFDATYDPATGKWMVCERMPKEVCLPAGDLSDASPDDLQIINCRANGTCTAHPIRTLADGEACGRAGRLRQLTCLEGCTLVQGQHPITVTGTLIPLGLVLLVLGSGAGVTFLSMSRRGRELEEEFDDIFHLDPTLVTSVYPAPSDELDTYESFYGTVPLESASPDET